MRRLVVLLLVPALWLSFMPVARARLVAKSSLVQTATGATKIKVKLSSTVPVTRRTKPRSVKMNAGSESYPLTLSSSTTSTKLGTWKSDPYTGAQQEALLAHMDQTVQVVVISRSGTKTIDTNLNPPNGWVVGQEAIDQMTQTLNGGAVQFFSSSSSGDLSERYEFHMCTDGMARYYQESNHIDFGPIATEKFGQPWQVIDALIRTPDDYMGAIVKVTMTVQNDNSQGGSEINETFQTIIEYSEGSWYWEGNAVQTIAASCEPTI